MILFQCMGITGVILMFYGLLAFALTQVSTWFFWTLLVIGALLTITFVVTSLSRPWQATVVSFVALNLSWIFLITGKDWPAWALFSGGVVCVIALYLMTMKRVSPAIGMGGSLVVAGTYAALAHFHEISWFNYGAAGAAFLYNGIGIYLSRIFLRDLFKSRSLQYGTSAAVYSAIAFATIVVFNIFSNDKHHQWDFTESQISKLTDQTTKVLKELKKPLNIYLFLDDRNPEKQGAKDLLQTYKYESKNIEIHFVDADKDKQLATEFAAKDGEIAIRYGEGDVGIKRNVTQEMTEEGLTQAIMKVIRTTNPTACFTKGHGELDIDAPDDQPRSASAIKEGLKNEGYVPKALDSIKGELPADCSMLVIAGPVQAFTSDEAKTVDKYLAAGGKALVMLDPNVPDPRLATKNFSVNSTGLEEVLSKWGVDVGRNMILEKHLELLRGVQLGLTVIANTYGEHPIVTPLKGKQTVFQNVRSIRKKSDAPGTATEFISSAGGDASWAEGDVDTLFHRGQATPGGPGDMSGPVPIAVAVERPGQKTGESTPPSTRLVVYGDSDFASNAMVRSYEFNFDLVLNSLNWLQGEVEQISIRPKKLRSSAIELTPQQSNTLFYVAIIGLPMLVLIFGLDLWWWRRRRG